MQKVHHVIGYQLVDVPQFADMVFIIPVLSLGHDAEDSEKGATNVDGHAEYRKRRIPIKIVRRFQAIRTFIRIVEYDEPVFQDREAFFDHGLGIFHVVIDNSTAIGIGFRHVVDGNLPLIHNSERQMIQGEQTFHILKQVTQ
ncbi:MAG: hypothetical protein JEZ11_20240 [Desulfobacterales bacterium]|nr:hypothetical protein [Desulfobacterales bacterium]